MLPFMHEGDLAVLRRQHMYSAGEVVAYHIPDGEFRGRRIIHRIVGGNGLSGFVMKGDNKPDSDLWHPRPSDIEGRTWVRLPSVGGAITFACAPAVLAAVAAGFAFAFTLTWQRRRE
jgi:signal peptidase